MIFKMENPNPANPFILNSDTALSLLGRDQIALLFQRLKDLFRSPLAHF